MRKEYVMGNGAIALGALAAGLNLVAGYPGTVFGDTGDSSKIPARRSPCGVVGK